MTESLQRVQQALAPEYRVARELGAGGMATVYLADDLRHHRRVAVKVMHPGIADAMGAARFLQEIEIVAGLAHPHILPLHDSGEREGLLYFVMPYVEGETLRERLKREGTLPTQEALRLVDEVADALEYAHAHGVIHRDIKPENILLQSGHAVVADFGIARPARGADDAGLTQTGLAVGTPAYMSPEQASGERELDARSDVYSLGAVANELLPADSRPALLDAAVRRALARDRAERFSSAAAFRTALREAVTGTALGIPRHVSARSRTLALVGAVAVVVVAALVVRFAGAGRAADPRLGLAVFPFRPTVPAAEELSEQLPDLLVTLLDGTPGMRVADPWALWSGLRPARGARAHSPADLADAVRLARAAGAGRFVLGTIGMEHERVSATLRVYGPEPGEPMHVIVLDGPADSVGALGARLAVALIARLAPGDTIGVPAADRFGTQDVAALKSFLRAREEMRRGDFERADREIDASLVADSTFALALVEAVVVKSWAAFMRGQPYLGLAALVERAHRQRDSLSARNRLRIEGVRASVFTDGPSAASAFRRLLEIDPTDLNAWLSLAYVHRVYGWQYGEVGDGAAIALASAIALDSAHVPALVSMISLVDQNSVRDAERYVRLLGRVDTASALARGTLLAHRAAWAADPAFTASVDSLALLPIPLVIPVLRSLRTVRPDRAERLITRLNARIEPGSRDFRNELARFLAATGRYAQLDSTNAARGFTSPLLPNFMLLAPMLAGVGDSLRAASAVAALEAEIPRIRPSPGSARVRSGDSAGWSGRTTRPSGTPRSPAAGSGRSARSPRAARHRTIARHSRTRSRPGCWRDAATSAGRLRPSRRHTTSGPSTRRTPTRRSPSH